MLISKWYHDVYKTALLRISVDEIKAQFVRIRFTFIILLLGLISGKLAIYLMSHSADIPLGDLTRDPSAIMNYQFYNGLLSYLSIVGWGATTTVCLFGALLVNSDHELKAFRSFLIVSGLLNGVLLLDDTLMLHEHVFPELLGIPEYVVYGLYGALASIYLLYFLPQVIGSEFLFLTIALMFFTLSILLDKALPTSDMVTFAEDSVKLFGIIFWLTYFTRTIQQQLRTSNAVNSPL